MPELSADRTAVTITTAITSAPQPIPIVLSASVNGESPDLIVRHGTIRTISRIETT